MTTSALVTKKNGMQVLGKEKLSAKGASYE